MNIIICPVIRRGFRRVSNATGCHAEAGICTQSAGLQDGCVHLCCSNSNHTGITEGTGSSEKWWGAEEGSQEQTAKAAHVREPPGSSGVPGRTNTEKRKNKRERIKKRKTKGAGEAERKGAGRGKQEEKMISCRFKLFFFQLFSYI